MLMEAALVAEGMALVVAVPPISISMSPWSILGDVVRSVWGITRGCRIPTVRLENGRDD